jgi:hypothetical protein
MFFAIFEFFLKIYQNMGQKLGSNMTVTRRFLYRIPCLLELIHLSFFLQKRNMSKENCRHYAGGNRRPRPSSHQNYEESNDMSFEQLQLVCRLRCQNRKLA